MSRKRESYLYVSRPLVVYFLLCFVFLVMLFIFAGNSVEDVVTSDISFVFQNKSIFSHLERVRGLSYKIKSRNSLNSSDIHQVCFRVDVPKEVNNEMLMAIAQKIVRDTISREFCHSIIIDFGPHGYVNFAPFGNLFKAGEIPFDNYRNYRFSYVFF